MNEQLQAGLRTIKPLSPSLVTLLGVTAAEHTLQDVLKIIQLDAVLTAKLLRAANSAAFRRAQEVDSLGMAVSLLGERFVVGMAMELSSDGFFDQPLAGYESAAGDLWRHSIKAALAARLVCRYPRPRVTVDSNQAFTGGILHDIGKAVLSAALDGTAREMALSVAGDQTSYLQAEHNRLGYDHCEAGVALAVQWRLPECYRAAIGFHHKPDQAPDAQKSLVFAVHLGDAFAMLSGAGTGSDSLLYPLHPDHALYFDLSPENVQRILLDLENEFAAMTESVA